MNAQEYYDDHIRQFVVGNSLGYIPIDRDHERMAVEEVNQTQDKWHAMKLVKADDNFLTFNGMTPEDYKEYSSLRGY